MNASEWSAIVAAVLALLTGFIATIRFLVKHYLSELRPNSGSSLRDSVDRLEKRVDDIFKILLEK
jgi:hypothetical protein